MGYFFYKTIENLIDTVGDIFRKREMFGNHNSDWKKKYEELEKRIKTLEEKEN